VNAVTSSRAAVPAPDRALARVLEGVLAAAEGRPEVVVDELARAAAAPDASHVLLIPRALVRAGNVAQVAALLRHATATGLPMTFRSGGTSLSGQAGGAGVLVDVRRGFRLVEPSADGSSVRVGPGATVRAVNARLAPFGRQLGPDPASEVAATVGGVIANNSSGMACGTHANAYRTLERLVLVLPSGTVVDTGLPDADERLAAAEPRLHAGLLRLRGEIVGDPELRAEVERQYRGKNTMGYGLNSFLDHERPVDVLAHLMVGSEGTLGFVAEATFATVPVAPLAATGFVVLDSLDAATRLLPALVATGAATIELMDAASLRVIGADPEGRALVDPATVADHAALLVEYRADDPDALAAQVRAGEAALAAAGAPELAATSDPARRDLLWHQRKGLYAAVAGARRPGTVALLEDVAVPVAALASTCAGLQALFARHGYDDAVIFGHAKDGNIHFLLTEDLSGPAGIERQAAFVEDMVTLVLAAGGTLKAEHGTGRVMAPFVERQFGPRLYGVMKQVKQLCDPAGILNPGVLLSDDPQAHLRHLKVTPRVEAEVDRCVECGYCEPVCPSRDLTLTPRQRIAVRRARAAARAAGDDALDRRLARAETYQSIHTCAVDGLCGIACPVLINTGDLVRRLRAERVPGPMDAVGATGARHWAGVTRVASVALTFAHALPAALPTAATDVARTVVGTEVVPRWTSDLPRGGARRSGGFAHDEATAAAPGGSAAAAPHDEAAAVASANRVVVAAPSSDGVAAIAASPDGAVVAPSSPAEVAAAAPPRSGAVPPPRQVVLFAACVGAMFGAEGGGAAAAFRALCARAGVGIVEVAGIDGLCCGTPWKSKGLRRGYDEAARATVDALLAATRGGELPVVCDASSCTEGLVHAVAARAGRRGVDAPVPRRYPRPSTRHGSVDTAGRAERDGHEDAGAYDEAAARLRIVDAVTFAADELLPGLVVRRRLGSIAVHPTCSSAQLGTTGALLRVAAACAERVEVPDGAGCCAFAGDRGMLHPELTASATAAEATAARAGHHDAYVSCNRTCEIGMTRATGHPYRHVLEVLDDLTR
jgi:D-lactate dehydrogenase